MITYETLREMLPMRDTAIPLADDAPSGTALPDPPPDMVFVAPRLEELQDAAREAGPRVILVCAAAAVGKTTMARNLARDTKNPYWDLGQFVMGSGFFAGTISGAYGVDAYADVIDMLRTDRACLILDAADEALVGSTTLSFRTALDNLVEVLRGARGRSASVVLFGRHETVFEASEHLTARGLDPMVLEVSFFAEDSAFSFVRQRARAELGTDPLPEFVDLVRRFNERVISAVGARKWSDVESFLGYAPVLESLALFYARADNPYRKLSEFLDGEERLVWRLLGEMLDEVLKREADKFGNNFGGASEAKVAFGRASYPPLFQARLLLSSDPTRIKADPPISDDTDPEWLADLDEKLQEQLRLHPFVPSMDGAHSGNSLLGFAGVAFRDYVLALVICASEEGLVEDLVNQWSSPRVVPSIMLSRFIFDRLGSSTISATALPMVIDSHSAEAAEPSARELWMEWDSSTADDDVLLLASRGGRGGALLELRAIATDDIVNVGRRLANFTAVVPGLTLVVGESSPESALGPRVVIECEAISVRSAEMRVHVGSGANVVTARRVEGFLRSIVGVSGALELRVPPVPFPWQRFRVESDRVSPTSQSDLSALGLQIRSLCARFARGGMMYSVEHMNTIQAKGRVSRGLLDYFLSQDYIWRDEGVYRMDLPVSLDVVQRMDLDRPEFSGIVRGLADYLSRLPHAR